jgi:hypothetical protein
MQRASRPAARLGRNSAAHWPRTRAPNSVVGAMADGGRPTTPRPGRANGAERRLPPVPAWARELERAWDEVDVDAVVLDPAIQGNASTIRRAKRLLRLAAKHDLPSGKIVPLLQAWDGLLAAERARLAEMERWPLVAELRERAAG